MSLDSVVLLCWTKRVLTQKSIDKVDGDDGVGGSSTASLLCCIMDLLPLLWLLFMHYLPFYCGVLSVGDGYVCYCTILAVV